MANPSIHLSHSEIVSKLMHTWSNYVHLLVGARLVIFSATTITKFQGELPQPGR